MNLELLLVASQFHRLHRRQIASILERSGFYKWNSSHIGLLTTLAAEPKSTAELAQLVGLTKQATSLCIRDLAGQQLIAVRSRSQHVRVQLVYLTADGWAFLAHWMDALTALDQRYTDRVGAEEFQRLQDTLLLVVETLDIPQ